MESINIGEYKASIAVDTEGVDKALEKLKQVEELLTEINALLEPIKSFETGRGIRTILEEQLQLLYEKSKTLKKVAIRNGKLQEVNTVSELVALSDTMARMAEALANLRLHGC